MEACKEPVLTVSSNKPETEVLRIPVDCKLESLYESDHCPAPVKNALKGMISWHQRNETTVSKALRHSTNFSEFKACLTVMDVDLTPADSVLEIPLNQRFVHFSDVRGTPDSDPIVACYAGVETSQKKITNLAVILTGIQRQEFTKLPVTDLIGKGLNADTIQHFCDQIPNMIEPQNNYLGSSDYRRAMAVLTTKRALTACMEELNNA